MRLPADVAAAVRVASVAPAIRALVRRAGGLRLEILLGADALDLAAVPGLLKLAEIEPASVELTVRLTAGATTVAVERHALAAMLGADQLARGLDEALGAALAAVVSARDLADLAHRASAELARVTALQAVVERMLAAPDEHGAVTALLAGVTAGSGLGFHRAALFVPDGEGGFRGLRAVGPADRDDAHRIWESIEADGVAFGAQLDRPGVSSKLEELVRDVRLAPREASAADAVAVAVRAEGIVFDGGTPLAAELAPLDPASSFVLCRVASGDQILALLFADRRFGDPSIDAETARALAAFLAHAALAWHTRSLLRETERLARRDPLTGLWNRRALEELLAAAVHTAARDQRGLVVLLLDLDHFRDVNTARGHPGGDALLREAAEVLLDVLGTAGHGARFGGDELAAILPGADARDAARIADAVGRAAAAHGVSLSIGGAIFPEDGTDASALVAAADLRLYAAKAAGRGRAVVPGSDAPLVFR